MTAVGICVCVGIIFLLSATSAPGDIGGPRMTATMVMRPCAPVSGARPCSITPPPPPAPAQSPGRALGVCASGSGPPEAADVGLASGARGRVRGSADAPAMSGTALLLRRRRTAKRAAVSIIAGSHGPQGPEVCTPDAVFNGSCTLL